MPKRLKITLRHKVALDLLKRGLPADPYTVRELCTAGLAGDAGVTVYQTAQERAGEAQGGASECRPLAGIAPQT